MAKEPDLKKIELKVSVNCCDGCKKKVRKVLRSIEGVYKTEIDPLQPKVTVIGNVEPQTLIRKLLKVGKQAEMWSYENQNAGKETKEVQVVTKKEQDKENTKAVRAEAKWSDTSSIANVKVKESANGGEGGGNKSSEKDTSCMAKNTSNPDVTKKEKPLPPPQPEVTCIIHPSMLQYDKDNIKTDTKYCYVVEPCTIALPYHAIQYSHQVPPPSPTCCSSEHYYLQRPISQPLAQTPTEKVGDYFSDDNTSGCHVM